MQQTRDRFPGIEADQHALTGASLLELFSPVGPHVSGQQPCPGNDKDIWSIDAMHRARNLVQLSRSLGSTGLRHLHGIHADSVSTQARALARAYEELASADVIGRLVPCGGLLEIVATRLIALFKGDRAIRLYVAIDHVVLPAEQRRALVLIASELLINALKYAFPDGRDGTITMALNVTATGIELSVADNGGGASADTHVGHGSALMHSLASLLDAELLCSDNAPGLKVRVTTKARS